MLRYDERPCGNICYTRITVFLNLCPAIWIVNPSISNTFVIFLCIFMFFILQYFYVLSVCYITYCLCAVCHSIKLFYEVYVYYGPPLWSSGQSSWQQTQKTRVRFRRYQIFWEVAGLERGPLSLVRIIEELLEWKSSGFGCRKPRLRLTTRHPLSAKSWH
jgi:hypothetical protein